MRKFSYVRLNISMPYLHLPKGRNTYYYRRSVPKALRRVLKKAEILRSLKTTDKNLALLRMENVHMEVEAQLRRAEHSLQTQGPASDFEAAIQAMQARGINPFRRGENDDDLEREAFYEEIDGKFQQALPKSQYQALQEGQMAVPIQLLSPQDRIIYETLKNDFRPNASDYLSHYIALKKSTNKKRNNAFALSLKMLLECLPDRPPGSYARSDVNAFINDYLVKKKGKTTTLKRHLNNLGAMFSFVALERDFVNDLHHPFKSVKIPQLGNDSEDRREFTQAHLVALRASVEASEVLKPVQQLMVFLMETGLRVAEGCGLKVSDIRQVSEEEGGLTYLSVEKNAFRRLKTKNSKRLIPLVGLAEKHALNLRNQHADNEWLFPDFVNLERESVRNDAASKQLVNYIRKTLNEEKLSAHSFRHTLRTRLKRVGCPESLIDELQGWASSTSDRYGSPGDLEIKREYLQASLTQ